MQLEVVFQQAPPPSWNLQYRFNFGDEYMTNWAPEPHAKHPYSSPTPRTYTVYGEIGVKYRNTVESIRKIEDKVQIVASSRLTPTATASVPASPSPYSPSPTAIVPSGFITATPWGNSISTASPTVTPSARESNTVTLMPTFSGGKPSTKRTSPIFYIIGAGVGVMLLAYLLYPRPKPNPAMAVRPTFHPRTDWDAPQKPSEHLAINYELHFQSNISSGQNWLQIDGPNLILRKAIQ